VYEIYIVAGKFAAIFNIDPITIYEITRTMGGVAILVATYWLITILLPVSLQIPAMIFTMVFDTGPMWANITHTPIWQWTAAHPELDLLIRRFWLPHHLWAEALGLALVCMILREVKHASRIGPIMILFLSVAGTLTNPTYFIILITCLFLPWLVYATITKTLKRTFLPIALSTMVIVLTGLSINVQFSLGPPWNNFFGSEKTWWTNDLILSQFVQSFGLFYPFVTVLIILVLFTWKKWSNAMRQTFFLVLCWSVLPVGLIYLSAIPQIPLVNGRIGMDLSQVPIGILATLIFYAVGQLDFFRRPAKIFVTGLFLLVLGVSLILSTNYFRQMIQDEDTAVFNLGNSWTVYPTFDLWNGIMALKKIPPWSHIMVCPRVGDILPAFLPIRVYQGNPYGDTDWIPRRGLSYVFYTGEMSMQDIRKLFTDNKITYVFYGPEEKTALKTKTFYPDLLEPIYINPEVTIYKVKTLPL